MVGVVKEKRYALPSVWPLTAAALASIVTSYFVANGNFFDGVKMSVVVPDQRNAPATSGAMWNHGTVTTFGILPTTTIGSLNPTRTSLASESCASSPTGPALATVSFSAAWTDVAQRNNARRTHFFMSTGWYARN